MLDDLKPQPERLYGRHRGHPLRQRQKLLLEDALPRFKFNPDKNINDNFDITPQKLFLEIGFGGGEHALDQAQRNADTGYIAAEVFENGICSLLSQSIKEGEEKTAPLLPNLRLWNEDARLLLKSLPDHCLDRAYLMFPDPWPKARHAKRRFIYPGNIAQMARILKIGASWRIASDHPIYQEWVHEIMGQQPYFKAEPPSLERPQDWSPTRYEAKAFREGRQPFYWNFIRQEV